MRKWLFIAFLGLVSCQGAKEMASESNSNPRVDMLFFDAQTQKAIENNDKAYNLFQQALALDPRNDAILYELALLEVDKKNNTVAISNLKEAIEISPKNLWYRSTLCNLYIVEGEYEQALDEIQTLKKLDPKNVDYLFLEADLYLENGDLEKALKSYQKVEEQIGVNELSSFQKEFIYSQQGKHDKAMAELEKLSAEHPKNLDYKVYLVEKYLQRGELSKAEVQLDEMRNIDPENGIVHFLSANLEFQKGNNDKASIHMNKAFASKDVNLDAKLVVLQNLYSISVQDPTELKRAHELLDLALLCHPNEARIHAISGDYYLREQRVDESISAYYRACQLDPSSLVIWQQLLNTELLFSRYDSLMIHSEEAIEIFPSNPPLYLFKGSAEARLEEHEKAIETFENALLYVIGNAELEAQIYAAIGESAHALKDYKRSDEAYQKAIELQPSDAGTLNNYSYYLSIRNERLDDAEAMAKKALELSPNSPSIQDTYAWILYQQGKYDEALIWIELAVKNTPSQDPTLLDHYGDILFELNRKDEALEIWKIAIEKGGDAELINAKIKALENE